MDTATEYKNMLNHQHTWAQNALARMNPDTQADTMEIARIYWEHGSITAGEAFTRISAARQWKLWETLAVKDIVLALKKEQK